jgi:DNA invertase Pin-like site-specific DNA recombinase
LTRPPANDDPLGALLGDVATLDRPPEGQRSPPSTGRGKNGSSQARAAVFGYASIPAGARPDGPELSAQTRAIEDLCARRGWRLVELIWDPEPADGTGPGRPGLTGAMRRIAALEASGLVVSSLDRLSRSASDLGTLLEWFTRNGVRLAAADLGLDTASPEGRLSIRTLVAVGRFERQRPDEPAASGVAGRERGGGSTPPAVGSRPRATADKPSPSSRRQQRRAPAPARAAVVGYASIPAGAGPDGPELSAQARAIEGLCAQKGLRVVELVWDHEPADGRGLGRPGLTRALRRIAAGEQRGLVVASLDRLSRSASDLGTLIEWFNRNGVRLVAADLGLDTASSAGRLPTRALVAVGRLERQRRGEPTGGRPPAAEPSRPSASRPEPRRPSAPRPEPRRPSAPPPEPRRPSAPPPEPRRPSARPAAPKAPALKERTAAIRARGTKLLTAFEFLKVDAGSMLRGRLSRGTGRRGALGLLAAGAVVTAGVAGFVTGHTGGGAAPSRGPTAGEVARFRQDHERRKQLERAAAAMKRLDAVRVDGRSRLARARTSTAQARAAAELARAHGAAAGALASPLIKPLAAELRRSQRGYLALADAARRDDQSAYGQARSSINQADARVQQTIKALRLP